MIQQIIPANGWHAVFVTRGDAGEVELYTIPISVWALVEHQDLGDKFRGVTGYGATDIVDPVDDCPDFLGYLHEGDPEGPEKYRESAERHLRWVERRERREREAGAV